MFNISSVSSQEDSVTIYDHRQILDQVVDHPEDLSCGSPSFVLRQSVQPLQDSFQSNAILSENISDRFDCDAIGKVTRSREWTHLTVPA